MDGRRAPDGVRTSHATRARLSSELRRLRGLAGVSGRDLGRQIGISQSKVSRIESGLTMPSLPEVTAWAEALDVPAQTREMLVALTEMAFTEVRSWRAALRERPHLQGEVQDREARARRSCVFQTSTVPGLLQTPEYARRVFSLFEIPYSPDDLAAAVAARLDRQLILYDEAKEFRFLITEAALRWRPGPRSVQRAQLDRIAALSTLHNVTVGLIPQDRQAVTFTSHGFVIYEGDVDDKDAFVEVETIHANLIVNDPEDVRLYQERWTALALMAVSEDEARRLLADLAVELDGVGE